MSGDGYAVTTSAESHALGRRVSVQANEVEIRGFFSTDIETMDDLFVHTLRGMYYAEQQILQTLTTMVEKATGQLILVVIAVQSRAPFYS